MNFDVIFDNAGGTTLQTNDGFRHHYDDPTQAARDVKVLLDSGNTSDWDGNESELFPQIQFDFETHRNGGYLWFTQKEISDVVMRGILEQSNYGWGWGNAEQFFAALGVDVRD